MSTAVLRELTEGFPLLKTPEEREKGKVFNCVRRPYFEGDKPGKGF